MWSFLFYFVFYFRFNFFIFLDFFILHFILFYVVFYFLFYFTFLCYVTFGCPILGWSIKIRNLFFFAYILGTFLVSEVYLFSLLCHLDSQQLTGFSTETVHMITIQVLVHFSHPFFPFAWLFICFPTITLSLLELWAVEMWTYGNSKSYRNPSLIHDFPFSWESVCV